MSAILFGLGIMNVNAQEPVKDKQLRLRNAETTKKVEPQQIDEISKAEQEVKAAKENLKQVEMKAQQQINKADKKAQKELRKAQNKAEKAVKKAEKKKRSAEKKLDKERKKAEKRAEKERKRLEKLANKPAETSPKDIMKENKPNNPQKKTPKMRDKKNN